MDPVLGGQGQDAAEVRGHSDPGGSPRPGEHNPFVHPIHPRRARGPRVWGCPHARPEGVEGEGQGSRTRSP